MKVTRRSMIAGAAALPVASQARGWRWEHHGAAVLVYDPHLPTARGFAEAGREAGREVLALEGDRIRFARELFAARPLLVRGISRQSDAVLVQEVAREAGYDCVAERVDGVTIDWTLAPRSRA